MKFSELITVKRIRGMFGKLTGEYSARVVGSEWQGKARSKEEALQNLLAIVRKASQISYQPVILLYKGKMAVVWQTPWGVMSAYPDETGRICGIASGSKTIEEEVKSCRLNIAQITSDINSNELPAILKGHDDLINKYKEWLGWQRAFRAATGTDNEKRAYASQNQKTHIPQNLFSPSEQLTTV
jgi:hypothetical protein